MKRLLCLIGIHDWEWLEKSNEPACYGGTLSWKKCRTCGKETEGMCSHAIGPIKFTMKDNVKI